MGGACETRRAARAHLDLLDADAADARGDDHLLLLRLRPLVEVVGDADDGAAEEGDSREADADDQADTRARLPPVNQQRASRSAHVSAALKPN